MSLGSISTLSEEQFDDLGRAVLAAWEQGRLTELIAEIAESEDLDESALLDVLVEARVLTALQTVEVVRTKLEAIQGLRRRIAERELENAVRDFIAKNPWLISPEWETFKKESGLRRIIREAAAAAALSGEVYRGRVDLTMASGHHLLVLEFVRPGRSVDWDHLSRFERYVRSIRSRVRTITAGRFSASHGVHCRRPSGQGGCVQREDRGDGTGRYVRARLGCPSRQSKRKLERLSQHSRRTG